MEINLLMNRIKNIFKLVIKAKYSFFVSRLQVPESFI